MVLFTDRSVTKSSFAPVADSALAFKAFKIYKNHMKKRLAVWVYLSL